MFTIYQTNIGGRVSRRYFRTWAAAKIAIDKEIQEYKKLDWEIIERSNRMNGDKGFYEYGVRGQTSEGEEFSAALIEAYFEDDINIYESCFVILLNKSNRIIGWYKVSSGGLDATIIDKRIICKVAIDALASGVILVHNHHSGEVRPSPADIKRTEEMRSCLHLFDIALMDHIILSEKKYYTFTDERVGELPMKG